MILDRVTPPAIKDAVDFSYHLPALQATTLDNGVALYAINLGAQDVVQVELVFEAGIWHEPKIGVAQSTAALLKNGTLHKTAATINEAIEKYGATLKTNANNDFSVITLTTLTKHLVHILPIVREVLMEPAFKEEELALYKKNAHQRLMVNLKRSDFVSNRNIDAFVFGRKHPYGSFVEFADIDALQVEDLKAFHYQHYNNKNCKIFIAGKYQDADMELVIAIFGSASWNSQTASTIANFVAQPLAEKQHRIINDPDSVQGAIRIARPFIGRTHPDFPASLVMNTLFGGYFGSRLMSNIREEKGYTYGIYSQFYAYKNASMYLIATEAGKDVCEATVQEVIKEAQRLQQETISEEELLLVKNYILGNLLGDLDGAFSIISRWKSLILNNLDINHFNNNIQVYKNVDAATIQEMAQKYLNIDDFYNLIVY